MYAIIKFTQQKQVFNDIQVITYKLTIQVKSIVADCDVRTMLHEADTVNLTPVLVP